MSFRNSVSFLVLSILCSALAASFFSTRCVDYSKLTRLELEVNSNVEGNWQLFFDTGCGFNERSSVKCNTSEGLRKKIIFPLPAKRTYTLRLDPIDLLPQEFEILSLKIKHMGLFSLGSEMKDHLFPIRGLTPLGNHTYSISSGDPQFIIDLEKHPYVLAVERETIIQRFSFWMFFAIFCAISFILAKNRGKWFESIRAYFIESCQTVAICLIGAIIASYFAFLNGYPLLYSDSGMHILTAFDWFVPTERTVMYGWFLKITGYKAWAILPILAQSGISVYVILIFSRKLIVNNVTANTCALIIVCLLVTFSSYGWFAGQLLPDFICVLSPLILLFFVVETELKWGRAIFLIVLFYTANLSHTSSMLIALIFSASLLLCFLVSKNKSLIKRSLTATLIALASFPLLIGINTIVSGKMEMLSNQPLFLAARFIQIGTLQDQLKEEKYRSFEIKKHAQYIVADNDHFLWNEESIKNRIPGEILKKELKILNRDILLDPGKCWLFFKYGLKQTVRLSVSSYYSHDSYRDDFVNEVISDVCPHHVASLEQSKQYLGQINQHFEKEWNHWFTYLSIVVLILGSLVSLILKFEKFPLWILGFVYLVIVNDFVCGFLSAQHSRYHLRASWILFLVAMFLVIFLINHLQQYRVMEKTPAKNRIARM